MNPYENLIADLSAVMQVPLKPDHRQGCFIHFDDKQIAVHIDLDVNGDRLVIGTELGLLAAGTYREKIFIQAMRVNGLAKTPRGFLAFSEKKNALVLYQFLPMSEMTGEILDKFLILFVEHARIWKAALMNGIVPDIEEDVSQDKMFGLKK